MHIHPFLYTPSTDMIPPNFSSASNTPLHTTSYHTVSVQALLYGHGARTSMFRSVVETLACDIQGTWSLPVNDACDIGHQQLFLSSPLPVTIYSISFSSAPSPMYKNLNTIENGSKLLSRSLVEYYSVS